MGVAVVADSYWNALQARKKLNIEWNTKGYETFNLSDYENGLRKLAAEDGLIVKNIASVESVSLNPESTMNVFYETLMVAHHVLEPMNCIAHVQGDKVEIWTSTQVPGTITGKDLEAVVGGNTVTNPFMVTEVYIKENGRWKMGSLTFSRLLRPVKMNNN